MHSFSRFKGKRDDVWAVAVALSNWWGVTPRESREKGRALMSSEYILSTRRTARNCPFKDDVMIPVSELLATNP
jgi:hypothetical protein